MASQELNQALWNAANVMRSTMSADEYKDYLLGMIFYKYLSDRQLYAVLTYWKTASRKALMKRSSYMRKPVKVRIGMT